MASPETKNPTKIKNSAEPARSKWPKRKIGIVGTAALVMIGVGIWLVTKPKALTPKEQQQKAIGILERGTDHPSERRAARKIALELQNEKFHDPDFPGAAEYILGIVAYRDGLDTEEDKREERFDAAVKFLRDAERLTLNGQYRPEWAYALGCSLHALGSPAEARPYIEEALKSLPENEEELTEKLVEIYLELKAPSLLAKALVLIENRLANLNPTQEGTKSHDLALLSKAQVLVALERTEEALQVLPKINIKNNSQFEVQIIQAQTLLALKTNASDRKAHEILQSLIATNGVREEQSRQVYYLLGVCQESLGDMDRAINQYERTTARYPKSHEGVAASLKQAQLLQQAGRDEEALAAYKLALSTMPDPKAYHNRWVSIEQFRIQILAGWNRWVIHEEFTNAIGLSKLMPPLFTTSQASELEARAYEKWAESYEESNAVMHLKEPKAYQRESRERWNATGDAYSRLAEHLKATPKYSDVIWKSAEYYIRGYRFEKAQAQLERFIASGPRERLPAASVLMAYTQLNEDESEQALKQLKRTVQLYPKDPSVFRAAFLIGLAQLERKDYVLAQQTWRDIIKSSALSPDAREWRDSLYALGSTLYHVTSAKVAKNSSVEAKLNQSIAEATLKEPLLNEWDESIGNLNEYVRRYPNQEKYFEAQYLLARSYQKSANEYQAKLQSAQIANEKQELAKEYNERLRLAGKVLSEVRRRLLAKEAQIGLDQFQKKILQNTFFDSGDIAFAMHEYEHALLVYSSAINRYPNHVRVLVSYLQMAQCYDELNKPEEARSTLKQAQILSQRMEKTVFNSHSTNLKDQALWTDWFEWNLKMMSQP